MKKEILKLTPEDFYHSVSDFMGLENLALKGGTKRIYEASTVVLMNGSKVSKVIKNRYGLSDSEIRSMVEVPDRRLLISQL
jgi:hypothetical protein